MFWFRNLCSVFYNSKKFLEFLWEFFRDFLISIFLQNILIFWSFYFQFFKIWNFQYFFWIFFEMSFSNLFIFTFFGISKNFQYFLENSFWFFLQFVSLFGNFYKIFQILFLSVSYCFAVELIFSLAVGLASVFKLVFSSYRYLKNCDF